jgi:indolepyruvate ferredoxin oxidoreductase
VLKRRALKSLRGTPFDIFGYSEEWKLERALIIQYAARMRDLLPRLTPANYDIAVEIASVLERIRG